MSVVLAKIVADVELVNQQHPCLIKDDVLSFAVLSELTINVGEIDDFQVLR